LVLGACPHGAPMVPSPGGGIRGVGNSYDLMFWFWPGVVIPGNAITYWKTNSKITYLGFRFGSDGGGERTGTPLTPMGEGNLSEILTTSYRCSDGRVRPWFAGPSHLFKKTLCF